MEYTNIKFKIENGIAHLILARDDIRMLSLKKTFQTKLSMQLNVLSSVRKLEFSFYQQRVPRFLPVVTSRT